MLDDQFLSKANRSISDSGQAVFLSLGSGRNLIFTEAMVRNNLNEHSCYRPSIGLIL